MPTRKEILRDEIAEQERRSRRKRGRENNAVNQHYLWMAFAGCGVLSLLSCCGVGIGFYFFLYYNPMIGRWDPKNADPNMLKWDFGYFGGGTARAMVTHPRTRAKEEQIIYFNYTYRSGNPAVLEISLIKAEAFGATKTFDRGEGRRIEVVFRDGEAVLTENDGGRRHEFVLVRPQ